MLPVALVCALLVWWRFGTIRVPAGMDTMGEAFPPGAVCLVDEHPSAVLPGQVVFVEVGGRLYLTRVAEVDDDGFSVANDDPNSRLGDGRDLGRLPFTALRGVVLTTFTPASARPAAGARPR